MSKLSQLASNPNLSVDDLLYVVGDVAGTPTSYQTTISDVLSFVPETSPAGSGTEIQYRNVGSFGAIANSSYDGTSVTIPTIIIGKGNVNNAIAAQVAFTIKAAASQSANLLEINNSSDGNLFKVNNKGAIAIYQPEGWGGASNAIETYANGQLRFSVTGSGGIVLSGYPNSIEVYSGSWSNLDWRSGHNTGFLYDAVSGSGNGILKYGSSLITGWTSGFASASIDAAIARNAAGVVEINSGTAGQYRDLILRKTTVAYDANNYFATTVNSSGNATFNPTGGMITVRSSSPSAQAVVVCSVDAGGNIPRFNLARDSGATWSMCNHLGSELKFECNNSTKLQVSSSGGLTSNLSSAAEIGIKVNLAATHTANAFEINSSGGSGGNKFKIDASGIITSPTMTFMKFADAGALCFHAFGTGYFSIKNSDNSFERVGFYSDRWSLPNGNWLGFSAAGISGEDMGLRRVDSSTLGITNATAGQYRDLNLRKLLATAGSATDVPLTVKLAATPTANAFEINSSGGSGGDLFRINSSGHIRTSTYDSPIGVDLNLSASGYTCFWISAGTGCLTGGSGRWISLQNNAGYGWGSASWLMDTAIVRNAAGVVEINNGTAGQTRDLVARTFIVRGVDGVDDATWNDALMSFRSTMRIRWNEADNMGGGYDVAIGRSYAGAIEINNGTAGQYRDLNIRHLSQYYSADDTASATKSFYKSRGTSASPTAITTGDVLGTITGYGYSGVGGYVAGTQIRFESTGTVATTRIPGKIVFATGTDAAPTVLTDRMTINKGGHVSIAGTSINESTLTLYETDTYTLYLLGSNAKIGFNAVGNQYPGMSVTADGTHSIFNLGGSITRGNVTAMLSVDVQTSLVGINKSSSIGAQLHIVASSASTVGEIIQAAASQSANRTEWRASNGTTIDAKVTAAGHFSGGNIASSERFGDLAGNSFESGVGSRCTAVGYQAMYAAGATSVYNTTAIGAHALSGVTSGTNGTVAVGTYALKNTTACSSATVVGADALVSVGSYDGATAIGYGVSFTSGATNSIGIGRSTEVPSSALFVAGSSSYPINTVYFGKGVTNATPTGYTISGTGGSGTDIAGANLTLAGGKGTGTGTGGSVYIANSPSGTTGSASNATVNTAQFLHNPGMGLRCALILNPDNGNYLPAYCLATVNATSNVPFKFAAYDSSNACLGTSTIAALIWDRTSNWVVIGSTSGASAQLHVKASAATTVGQIIQLAATPTANAFEINSSSGSGGDLFRISSTGAIIANSNANTISYLRFTTSGSAIFRDMSARVRIANYEGTDIAAIQTDSGGAGLSMLKPIGFTTNYTSLGTVAIDRDSDGVLAIHDGTAGQYRDLKLRKLTATAGSATDVPATIVLASAQSANALTVFDSDGSTTLAAIKSSGAFRSDVRSSAGTSPGYQFGDYGVGVGSANNDTVQLHAGNRVQLKAGYSGGDYVQVVGGSGGPKLELGASSATPAAGIIKIGDASGTNIAGANLTLAGGQSTGTGAGGSVLIQLALPGTTGSSLNSLTTLATFAPTSPNVLIQSLASSHVALRIKAAASQSSSLTEWQNSSGTSLTSIQSDGALALVDAPTTNPNLYSRGTLNFVGLRFSGDSISFTYGGGTMVTWSGGNPGSFSLSTYSTPLIMGSGPVRGVNANGTNVSGGVLRLYGGTSTGNASGGNVVIGVSLAGTSGSSSNAISTLATFSPVSPNVLIESLASSHVPLSIKGATSQSGNLLEINTNAGSGGDILRMTSGGVLVVNSAGTGRVQYGQLSNNYIEAGGGGITINSASGFINMGGTVIFGASAVFGSGWQAITSSGGSSSSTLNITTGAGSTALTVNHSSGMEVYSGIIYSGRATSATPSAGLVTATGGSGTNIAGANLTIAGGRGTGTGDGGSVTVKVAPAGSTGSSLNALSTIATFSTTSPNVLIESLAASHVPLSIKGATSQSGNLLEINTNGGSGGDLFAINSTGAFSKYLKITGANSSSPFESLHISATNGKIRITNTNSGEESYICNTWNALQLEFNGGASLGIRADRVRISDGTLGNVTPQIELLDSGGAIFNEQGNDSDFRIEGDTDPNLFIVDAGTDTCLIGTNTTVSNVKFNVEGAIKTKGRRAQYASITTANSPYTPAFTDEVIYVDDTSGNVTIDLRTVASVDGQVLTIKKITSGSYKVIIDGNGSETIDGGTTKELTVQYESVQIQAVSGAEWRIL